MNLTNTLLNFEQVENQRIEIQGILIRKLNTWSIADDMVEPTSANSIKLFIPDSDYLRTVDKQKIINNFLNKIEKLPNCDLSRDDALEALKKLEIHNWTKFGKRSNITSETIGLKKLTKIFFDHNAEMWLFHLIETLYFSPYALKERLSAPSIYISVGHINRNLPNKILKSQYKYSYPATIVADIVRDNNETILNNIQKIQIKHCDFSIDILPNLNLPVSSSNLVKVKDIIKNPEAYIGQDISISGTIKGRIAKNTTYLIYPNRAYLEFHKQPIYLCLKDDTFSHIVNAHFDGYDHDDSLFIADILATGEIQIMNNHCRVILTELKSIQLKKGGNLYTIKL